MNLLDLISGAGNLLDLPGSSVRDLLSGRNPFDQWTTPFSSDNRASGRDMLSPILGANKETGMSGWLSDPMEGLKDIAGFGAEVVTDPLNLIPAGWFGKVLGSRKATQAANAAVKAERGGKYSFVNPKLLARTADDAVKPVAQAVSDQNPMKLLGYTPPPETVYHGGWDWSASATPEHPYGMFDVNRIGTGEGAQAYGPGLYVADSVDTVNRYKKIAQSRIDREFMGGGVLKKYFEPGRVIENSSGGMDRVIEFNPTSHSWGVKVQAVRKNDVGEYIPSGPVREHATTPSADEVYKSLGISRQESNIYQLDMPTGSKDKFLNWNDTFSSQPPSVQNAYDTSEVGSVLNKVDDLDNAVANISIKLSVASKNAGLNPMLGDSPIAAFFEEITPPPAEVAALRVELGNATKAFEAARAEAISKIGMHQFELLYGKGDTPIRGDALAEMLMGTRPSQASFDKVSGLQAAGVPGTKNLANSTRGSSYNYAIWDPNLIRQMRVRAINGQRVPINPTTLVQRIEQPFQRAAVADPQLLSNMNPMNLQRPQTVANPVALALLQNLLSRNNNLAGGYQ